MRGSRSMTGGMFDVSVGGVGVGVVEAVGTTEGVGMFDVGVSVVL